MPYTHTIASEEESKKRPALGKTSSAKRLKLQPVGSEEELPELRRSERLQGVKLGEGLEAEFDFYKDPPKDIFFTLCDAKVDILVYRTRCLKTGEKTAAVLDSNTFTPTKKESIERSFASIFSNRPVAKLGEKSPGGTANSVMTPGGTWLHKVKKHNVITFYSSEKPKTYPHKTYQEAELKTKGKAIHLTPENYDEVLKELKKYKHKRPVGQVAVMEGNASSAATGLKRPYDMWEWLHLIAFSLMGKASQTPENLVGGINHANTDMMFIERQIPELVKFYKEGGVDITAKAMLEPGRHIAKKIYYTVKTPDFKLRFEFDAQDRTRPLRTNEQYFQKIISALLEDSKRLAKEKSKEQAELSPSYQANVTEGREEAELYGLPKKLIF